MSVHQAAAPLRIDHAACFAHRSTQDILIAAPTAVVVQRLHDVHDWPRHLAHVLEIDMRYDDGQYQEFVMVVASETSGDPLRVRSIRNCRDREIEFFQPEPPAFLRHHGGRWCFRDEDGGCRVEVTHVWNLREDVAREQFPSTGEASTEDQVAALLAGHSRLTLQTWQGVLGAPEEV